MRFLIVLALACCVLGLPQVPRSDVPTSIWTYPYVASLQQGFGNNLWHLSCAGTQLTFKTIVTAADCFTGSAIPNSWRVRLASEHWSSGGSVHDVSQFILHEDFNVTSKEKDVAVVILRTSASYNSPPSNAMFTYYLPHGEPVTVAGWPIHAGNVQDNEVLHSSRDLRVIGNEVCAKRWRELSTTRNVTDSMLCTGVFDRNDEIKNTCVGNMGSPILHRSRTGTNVIVGIYSWGRDCTNGSNPGVSTRYADVYNWIQSKTRL